jgi:hypothetical protein
VVLAAACSAGGDGADGSLGDLLALVPADDDYVVTFGDLAAHREAIGVPAPPADASDAELADHLELLLIPEDDRLVAARTSLGSSDQNLLPLARASAYISNFTGTEVIRGDFADDTFDALRPDGDGEPVSLNDGAEFVVEGDTVTIAPDRDEIEAALVAQRGDADSMADMPAAVEIVSALDQLDVIHGLAMRVDLGGTTDAVGSGMALDPGRDRSWLLVVARNPSAGADLDAVAAGLREQAAQFAARTESEVVEVAIRDETVTVTIAVDNPNLWVELQRQFDPLLFGDLDLEG